jgi:urease accessory protein
MKPHLTRFFKMGSLVLLGAPGWAQAHTGHGTESLMAGLAHPLGADHLLAMLAVGLWSVNALPSHKAWQGPLTFMLALVVSALLGSLGLTLPFIEHAIALSVLVFGGMVVLTASRQWLGNGWGLVLIAAAASLHGMAHGAEAPGTGFAGYALGFLASTACLHLAGVGVGQGLRRFMAAHSKLALGGLGSAMAGAGLYLFSHV